MFFSDLAAQAATKAMMVGCSGDRAKAQSGEARFRGFPGAKSR
jgi:hypothetical protein